MSSITEFLLIFFKIFACSGITPYFPARTPHYPSLIWLGSLSLILLSITVVVSYYYDQLLSNTGALSTSIDAFQLLSPIVCHLILIGESVIKVQLNRRMWESINRIESLFKLSGLNLSLENKIFCREYIISFLTWQIIPIVVETYIILTISKAREWQQSWIARIFSFNAIRMASMQYILWANYLASRSAIVCAELKSLEEHTRRIKLNPEFDRYLFNKLGQSKSLHRMLWRLSQDMNERFGIFILTTITNLFLSITVDLYWIYGNFVFGGNPFALQSFLCVLPPVITAGVIFQACQNVLDSSATLSRHLHGIQRSARDLKSGKMIMHFSLQVLKHPFLLTGCGFFILNNDLLQTMLGSITTYMVIIIGFMPSENIFKNITDAQ